MKRVGDILRKTREHKGLSYMDVNKFTKIHPKFLEALEENNYKIFSSPVHIKGFLKIYAGFLELNVSEILAFFRREYDEATMNKRRVIEPIKQPKYLITPATITTFSIIFLILLFFSYLFYQYRSFSGNPSLIIEKPSSDTTVFESMFEIVGKTDADASIFLNGQKIQTNIDGSFTEKINLSEGINTLNFLSVNKLQRESKLVRSVIYESKNKISSEKTLEVMSLEKAVVISVTLDGSKTIDVSMFRNTSRIFEATQSIKLKTQDAGSVKIKFNGKDFGLFGKTNEPKEQEFR